MELWLSAWICNTVSAEFYHTFIMVLGVFIGSFINVVVYRIALTMTSPDTPNYKFNLCFPASHCPVCKHTLAAWQNIPLVSWLLIRGKCHYCQGKISMSYPLTEAVCGLIFLLMSFLFLTPLSLLLSVIFCSFLLTLSLIDFKTLYLPDRLTLPLLWIGLLSHTFTGSVSLEDAVYGAAAGYLVLWSLHWFFWFVTRREGMGYGDFKLLAALGAWVGWQSIPLLCVLASFLGVSMALLGKIRSKNTSQIPFGPCLATGGILCYISQQSPAFWLMFF